jgi:hypothetical protein
MRTRRNNLVAILIFQLLNLFFPPIATAASIPLSAFGPANACNWPSNGGYGALIVAGTTTTISQIRIQYSSSTTLSAFNQNTIRIYSDAGSSPLTLLGTLNPSSLGDVETRPGASFQTKTGTYTGSASVTAGSRYWIVMNAASTSISACGTNSMVTEASGWSQVKSGPSFLARTSGGNFYWASIFTYEVTVGSVAPDTTPPTFTSSSSFSAAENIATSATAATIRISESATVTISSGADAARFNISRSETDTAIIKFNVSPDFEAPVDVGGNNVYEITLTATDAAANAGTQSITITVTDVVDTSSFNSLALAGSATTASYRTAIVITANITVASKVTFRVNGKILPGCKNKSTTGSSPNIVATCTWKPSIRGNVSLTASAAPTGAGISSSTSTPVRIMVGNRTGSRGA